MDLDSAHSCEHCGKLVLDLDHGRFDSTLGIHRLVFNFNICEIQQAYAQGCLLLHPIVSSWLTWKPSLFSVLTDRWSEIVLFADVEYHWHEEGEDEHYNCDVNSIGGMGLWDTVSKRQVHMPMAGKFYVITSKDDVASAAITSRPVAIDPASKETFALLRDNLASCLRMEGVHTSCDNVAGDYVPSRLLKLEARPQGPPKMRICSLGDPTPYVVLSYCWGGDQVHKTTSVTLADNYIDVRWDSLPRSIQDAVQVTLSIGLEYIWVDSICIIQDDDRDKQREIASMPRIYNESIATIIAARASSVQEGFLHLRDASKYKDNIFKLGFKCDHSTLGHAYLIKEEQYNFGESDPIDSRAWTLQEAYLSKRIIRFGSKQCSMVCQCSPSKPQIVDGWVIDQSYDTPALENIVFPELEVTTSPDDTAKLEQYYEEEHGIEPIRFRESTDEESVYLKWRELVMHYSTRSLTVPADRILAISGLADRIAPAIKSRYVVGHWENHLAVDLLWEIATASLRLRPTTYQGPSWSWTSVNGSVMNFNHMPRDAASLEILDVKIDLCDTLAPFGAVRSGLLRARGKLARARWNGTELLHLRKDGKQSSLANTYLIGSCLVPDRLDEEFIRISNHPQILWDKLVAHYADEIHAEIADLPTPSPEYDMYLLEMFPAGATTSLGDKLHTPMGLILKDMQAGTSDHDISSPRKLRRVGLFHFLSHSNRDSEVSKHDWEVFMLNQRHCFDNCEVEKIVIE